MKRRIVGLFVRINGLVRVHFVDIDFFNAQAKATAKKKP